MANARYIYEEITNRILEALESDDVAPWQRPWKVSPYGNTPRNPVSDTTYRGINVWLTMLTQWTRGYDHPLWLTFNQAHEIAAKAARQAGHSVMAKEVGRGKYTKTVYLYADGPNKGKSVGGIRKGQNKANGTGATTVLFWKRGTRVEQDDNGDEQTHSWSMLRTYSVFNVAQCDDHVRDYLCPPTATQSNAQPNAQPNALEKCQSICDGWVEVPITHGGNRAFYSASQDAIQLPNRERFESPEGYYTVRFHEMAHATGHPSRLARFKLNEHRRDHRYAEEELVAEFTACLLAGEAGILRTVEDNSAKYLRFWASKLREDPRLVVFAAQRAQKAADLILGRPSLQETADADEVDTTA